MQSEFELNHSNFLILSLIQNVTVLSQSQHLHPEVNWYPPLHVSERSLIPVHKIMLTIRDCLQKHLKVLKFPSSEGIFIMGDSCHEQGCLYQQQWQYQVCEPKSSFIPKKSVLTFPFHFLPVKNTALNIPICKKESHASSPQNLY